MPATAQHPPTNSNTPARGKPGRKPGPDTRTEAEKAQAKKEMRAAFVTRANLKTGKALEALEALDGFFSPRTYVFTEADGLKIIAAVSKKWDEMVGRITLASKGKAKEKAPASSIITE